MKNKKKRTKKYKGKYVTADRLDMSKGGRVKAQVGGIQKAPISRKRPPMSIEREDIPVQVGELAKSNDTRRGAESLRSDNPQTIVTDTLARPLPKAPIESKRPDVVQPQVTPKQPITPPQQEKFIENIDTAANNIDTTFRQAPTTGKKSNQMFIGREGEETRAAQVQPTVTPKDVTPITEPEPVKPQITLPEDILSAQQEAAQKTLKDFELKFGEGKYIGYAPEDFKFFGDKISDAIKQGAINQNTATGWWTDAGYNSAIEALQSGKFTFKDGQWVLKDGTENKEQKIIDEELVTARGRAEQILQGDMTGIPMAEAPKEVEIGELGEAKTMAEREALQAQLAEVGAAPEAATIEDVETVKTPEQLQAETYRAEQVGVTPDVELSQGEIQENALAKAAKVDRVAPIEGVEVEIPEGALAERVVGVISEGAKATAAINAGTSLSRITRAKKQLSRAGLSDEDIQEIGNDPEALEDRLADFSEEQRGIIEGLPEEALVSTQINGLLEGMENGEIPTWARPAVAQVEQMLARRGMSASTVGRDSLFNAIIQSAMPIAQSNAQAIQQSVSQQKTIEAQTAEANAQRVQQTALTNAQNVFNMDMAQFNADQQTSLSNSKFMQTVGITNANNAQQATIQNAVLMSQANLAEADFYQKAQINNANAFLNMDLTNLNNAQQVNVLKAQQEQQRLLSNQAANNAAAQFNATSENQTRQFMSGLNAQIEQFNAAQMNTTAQFNVQQKNARDALNFQVEADLEKANAAMVNQINQFNEQTAFERDKFNTANAQAIEQSNLAWRRQANMANTAAANQVNMQNVQNAFNMTSQAQSFLWQELRDQANYTFQSAENEENRKAQLYAQALANEGGSAENWKNNVSSIGTLINTIFGGK
jgi:hypothetical protein